MSLATKIVFLVLAAIFIGAILFGLHLKTVYNGFIASTDAGDPLFERELLEQYGEKLVQELANNEVKFAIVSRSGQKREKLPKGIMFTHSAFFLYQPQPDGTPDYAVYNLYHGEENRLKSSLKTDRPADFLRLLQEHDAGIIVPTQETQDELAVFVNSPEYDEVHQDNYSLISNPLDTRFQNCNEFMLDTMAALFWNEFDPVQIKARFRESLNPAEINASFLRRHIGPLVDERLIMADQSKPILTTTSDTLAKFLESEDRLERSYVLKLSGD